MLVINKGKWKPSETNIVQYYKCYVNSMSRILDKNHECIFSSVLFQVFQLIS